MMSKPQPKAVSNRPATAQPRVRVLGKPVPAEGENGLFSQSWFPICLSSEVARGKVIRCDFLDGHVAIFRGENGKVSVVSPFCPHLGADLTVGDVIGNSLRCLFHHWEYDQDGMCTKTGIGDPVPSGACVFNFPSVEKYGLIWAFNGTEPTWDVPDFPYPEDQLSIRVRYDVPTMRVDPWVVCCNTPDWQHIKVVHRVKFDSPVIYDTVKWTDHSMKYHFSGLMEHGAGDHIDYNVAIYGTSIFAMNGTMAKQWYAIMTPFGLPRPGITQNYFVTCFKKSDLAGLSDDEIEMKHYMMYEFGKVFVADDRPILQTSHFRPGMLTKSDKTLARYLDLLREFPRAHPAADFMK
jgi:phenylpropionate dioxygenase-like ring-hydroxylating dioxygenase large terminal subunit